MIEHYSPLIRYKSVQKLKYAGTKQTLLYKARHTRIVGLENQIQATRTI